MDTKPNTDTKHNTTNNIRSTDPIDTDVAVVGAGLAGLVAAIQAAQAGAAVTLIDRGPVGGRARSTRTDAGFCLNQGPHALYVGHALDRALRSFGIVPAGTPPSTSDGRGLIAGRFGPLPSGPGSLVATDLVPVRAKFALAVQLARIPRLDPTEYRDQSVDEWIASLGVHPSVRGLIEALVRLTSFCADTDLASADAVIAQIQSGLSTGVLYLDNGWQQLVDALSAAATSLGVETRTGHPVRQIEGNAIRFDDDSILRAGSVILAGLRPSQVASVLNAAPDLSAKAGPPIEAATLDIGVRGPATSGLVLGLDEPLSLTRRDPPAAMAPNGHCLYAAMRYLRHDDVHDHGETSERLLALAHQAGLAADTIVETRYSHRLRVADGQPLAAQGGLSGRPGVSALGVPGVFLAGDWIGPVGMLADASAASALTAADHAVAYARERVSSR